MLHGVRASAVATCKVCVPPVPVQYNAVLYAEIAAKTFPMRRAVRPVPAAHSVAEHPSS